MISFVENNALTSKCVDFEAEITLTDTKFFKFQIKDRISIKTMTILITMRNLETNKHSTDQYAITSIYFNEKNKND